MKWAYFESFWIILWWKFALIESPILFSSRFRDERRNRMLLRTVEYRVKFASVSARKIYLLKNLGVCYWGFGGVLLGFWGCAIGVLGVCYWGFGGVLLGFWGCAIGVLGVCYWGFGGVLLGFWGCAIGVLGVCYS